MDIFDLPPDDRRALAEICAKERVDESYASFVAKHLDEADKTWRWCCSSNCDPCVTQLGRAVDRARARLNVWPNDAPGGG